MYLNSSFSLSIIFSTLNGSDYYEFSIDDVQFSIYYDGADWTFESEDGESFAQAASSNPDQVSTGVWVNSGGNIYNLNDVDPAKPLFPVGFSEILADIQECLAIRGTEFLSKIKGGVKCSSIELSKLRLIYYLLEKYDFTTGDALECIFNGKIIEGYSFTDTVNFTPLNTNTYLETFLNFSKKYCKSCLLTGNALGAIGGSTGIGNGTPGSGGSGSGGGGGGGGGGGAGDCPTCILTELDAIPIQSEIDINLYIE